MRPTVVVLLFTAALFGCWRLASRLGGPPRWIRSIWNDLAFNARRLLAFRTGPPSLPSEPKDGVLFAYLDGERREAAEQRERELRRTYDLQPLALHSSCLVYRDNLLVLDMMDRFVDPGHLGAVVRAIDVGSQDFRYAFALERWLCRAGGARRQVRLDGVEVDGYVVYRDLRSRADYALAYAQQTGNPGVRFVVGDFLDFHAPGVDVVFMLFPFMVDTALLRWGLPGRFFAPGKLLDHAIHQLKPGGMLVVVNQSWEERDVLWSLLVSRRDVDLTGPFDVCSDLVHYRDRTVERTMTIVHRRA